MASGTEKRRRGDTITVRLTPDERAKVDAMAMERGLALGAFMRAAALGDAGPRAKRRVPVDQKLLRKLLGEFGRVGNNLNQIAHQLNAGDKVNPAELDAALVAHADIRAAILRVLEAPPIKSKSRGGSKQLAAYLLRADRNERVELLELPASAHSLEDAFNEWQLIAEGTPGILAVILHVPEART